MACKAQARKTCHQGRQPCPTPYACSGQKTTCGGESVNAGMPVEMFDNKPSMLASRWFWILGIFCIALWSGLWELVVSWLSHH